MTYTRHRSLTQTAITRPTVRTPQTLAQARTNFRKHGPRISSQEQRQLDRGAELFRRAEKIRLAEVKRKQAREKKALREEKERLERKGTVALGKVAASQRLLEGFGVAIESGRDGGGQPQDVERAKGDSKEDAVMVKVETVTEGEQLEAGNQPQAFVTTVVGAELWSDGGLDDITLLDLESAAPAKDSLEDITTGTAETSAIDELDFGCQGNKMDFQERKLATSEDTWDDFIFSNTQVEREISVEIPLNSKLNVGRSESFSALLSTQDILSSIGETHQASPPPAQDIFKSRSGSLQAQSHSKKENDALLMPPPRFSALNKLPKVDQDNYSAKSGTATIDFVLSTQDLGDFG